ncbi:MAG: PD-(D/E)XK nuclease family protein [Chloroflexi bacterium]|nr:PD-(D/E)XK nuclease family protein [Chloroflexota bacterium]MCY4246341.1 PD-(D/E)XK nuclease family protein [Chloroflexota bacterium]
MNLPANFVFSAKNLQSYADCPRRFQLRYVEGWQPPTMTAPEAQDELAYERRLRQGAMLHQLAKFSQEGIPHDLLKAAIRDDNVARWFAELLSSGLNDLPEKRLPEKRLQTSIDGQRLMAQVDLLAFEPGGDLVVVDWKTGSYVPDRESLRQRWQTIVYLYVAAKAGSRLYGAPLPAERVRLEYVYLARGGQRIRFTYSPAQMRDDEALLSGLMSEIQSASDFPLTPECRHCRFCAFRVHCERGEAVSLSDVDFDDLDEVADIELDFEQIGEYAF